MSDPKVLVIIGSDRDLEPMGTCLEVLDDFRVPNEVSVASPLRTPHVVERLAREAEGRGIEVIIAGSGDAAPLAGLAAAYTVIPVVGVPLESVVFSGVEALAATAHTPAGIPVASMGLGRAGVRNAAYQAIQILALQDDGLREALYRFRDELTDKVSAMNRRVQERLGRD